VQPESWRRRAVWKRLQQLKSETPADVVSRSAHSRTDRGVGGTHSWAAQERAVMALFADQRVLVCLLLQRRSHDNVEAVITTIFDPAA
jgi:hypothetical protein